MKKRINITQRDIDKGVRVSAVECPIALALCRIVHKPWLVSVGTSTAGVECFGKVHVWGIPVRAIRFVRAFDDGDSVQPFRFTLDIPDECLSGQASRVRVEKGT